MEKKRADSRKFSSRKEASHDEKDKRNRKEQKDKKILKTSTNKDQKKHSFTSQGTSASLKVKKPINNKEENFSSSLEKADTRFQNKRSIKDTPDNQGLIHIPLGSETDVKSNEMTDLSHISEWSSLTYSVPPEIPSTSSAIDPQEINHKNISIPSMKILASEFSDLEMVPEPTGSCCRKCNNQIVFDADLMKFLLEPMNRQTSSRRASVKGQSSSRTGSIMTQSSSHKESHKAVNLQCGVCGFHIKKGSMKQHMNDHMLKNQIYYCFSCQKDINAIVISALSEPHYRDQFLRRISVTSHFIETRKYDLPNCPTLDASVQPKCGKCDKVFDYIGPLLKKLLDCNVKVYETDKRTLGVDTCIIGCLCETAGDSISAMQRHVLEHVRLGDVNCRACQEESNI